jgi:hypothetical protein
MANVPPVIDIFAENPYEGHPNLSVLEGEVLWEYAKLAQHVKQVGAFFGFQVQFSQLLRVFSLAQRPGS